MNARRVHDGRLQMFGEEPRNVYVRHLRFLRWLGERGLLEHDVAGPPTGPDAFIVSEDPLGELLLAMP